MKPKLLIVGAGGHGRSVAEAVLAADDYQLIGFVDDSPGLAKVWGLPVLGDTADVSAYRPQAECALVAMGNNALRETLSDKLLAAGFELATVVHPRAIVSPRAEIGLGSAIMAGAIVGTEARLGSGVIVNSGAVVDHQAQVHDYGHLGVNACMAGGSVLGRSAWMQAGSALGYGVSIADGAILLPGRAVRQ
jgi:sugar O-acyltransferase (sialic acid O-acetyltransferase NeuD family)